jgi:3-dehydroquinate synthase class II
MDTVPWMWAEPPAAGVQVERRPLMLVEATAEDGEVWSTMLQNAETVRLVGPGAAADGAADPGGQGWQATSVSQLAVGSSRVYVLRQGAARHTGVAIQEQISER